MHHRLGRPDTLVEVIPIFGKTSKIHHAEIRTVRGPIVAVFTRFPIKIRSWFADIVESRPNELAENTGQAVLISELYIRTIGPARRNDVVAAELQRWIFLILHDWQVICTPGADARSS